MSKKLREAAEAILRQSFAKLDTIDAIYVTEDFKNFRTLHEGKWVQGRFGKNIRIDQQTHTQGSGPPHAHVYGRKGNELVVVNLDGSSSHGTKGKLHDVDAAALRDWGFAVRTDNVVEWTLVSEMPQLLLG